MKRILVLGGGRIGGGIAELLNGCSEYAVCVSDSDADQLKSLESLGLETIRLDIGETRRLAWALGDCFLVINALPVGHAETVAKLAGESRTHYLDLSEDVAARQRIREIAKGRATAFMPACGLAPGFAAILGNGLAQCFDRLSALHIRIGALPERPEGVLKYALTWSTEGLINQYCNPCEAILEGRTVQVPPLGGLENLRLDGQVYEAFNTSGGLGTLHESLAGKVDNLDYKAIRYPGHCEVMRLLIQDLKLGERRDLLALLLKHALPTLEQDKVLIHAFAQGSKDGQAHQEVYSQFIRPALHGGRSWSAIRRATAYSVAALADMLAKGQIPARGFVRQEDVALTDFLANRFGHLFAQEAQRAAA